MDQRLQDPAGAAPPNLRGLCEELADSIELLLEMRPADAKPLRITEERYARARAALAQPEPEVVGPTMQLPEQAPDEHPPSNLDRREIAAWYHGHGCGWQAARAVLARYGRPAPAPAGERQAAPVPVAVSERLPEPGVKVLAHYFNVLGKGRTICAIWVPAKTRSDSYGDDDFTEYDEETDKSYWPEGWYEAIENWDDLGYVKVDEGEVVYWQSLPQWPAHALPLPSGEVKP